MSWENGSVLFYVFMSLLSVLGALVFLAGAVFFAYQFYYVSRKIVERLAKSGKLFFHPPTDAFVFIERGERIIGVAGKITGFDLRENGDMIPLGAGEAVPMSFLEKYFGAKWLGADRIFSWQFSASGALPLEPQDGKVVSSISRRSYHRIRVRGAETQGASQRAQVTCEMMFGIEVWLPMVAITSSGSLSLAGKWLETLTTLVEEAAREWIGRTAYEEIINTRQKDESDASNPVGKSGLSNYVMRLNTDDSGRRSLKDKYGIVITSVALTSVELDDPAVAEAANQPYIERLKREAALEEVERRKMLAEAEKAEVAARIDPTAGMTEKEKVAYFLSQYHGKVLSVGGQGGSLLAVSDDEKKEDKKSG